MYELEKVTEAEYDTMMALNVKGPLFLAQANSSQVQTGKTKLLINIIQRAAPHISSGGRITLFSTTKTAASTVTPNYLAYCASKGAIQQLVRVLSKDLARKEIVVNTILPDLTATDLLLKGKPGMLSK